MVNFHKTEKAREDEFGARVSSAVGLFENGVFCEVAKLVRPFVFTVYLWEPFDDGAIISRRRWWFNFSLTIVYSGRDRRRRNQSSFYSDAIPNLSWMEVELDEKKIGKNDRILRVFFFLCQKSRWSDPQPLRVGSAGSSNSSTWDQFLDGWTFWNEMWKKMFTCT